MGGRNCQPLAYRQQCVGTAEARDKRPTWEAGKEGCRAEREPVGSQERSHREVLWKRIAAATCETINVSIPTHPCPGLSRDQQESDNCRARQPSGASRRASCPDECGLSLCRSSAKRSAGQRSYQAQLKRASTSCEAKDVLCVWVCGPLHCPLPYIRAHCQKHSRRS